MRPLIVRLRNWIGDVCLGIPTLERLEASGFALRLVGKGWARALLAGHGWTVTPLAPTLRGRVAQLRALATEARKLDPTFDTRPNALVLPDSFSSALEMRLAGLRAVGYRHEGRALLLARAVAPGAERHMLERYWALGTALLGATANAPSAAPLQAHLRVAPSQREAAAALRATLQLKPGYVVVCPFAGGTFEKLDKCWPDFPRWVAEDAPSLGRSLVICPGPGAEEQAAERDYPGCTIARGVGLGTYAALLADAALVVANDTGPGHMAAAVGAPLVSVLGPTDAGQWGALGPSVRIVQDARRAGGWPERAAVTAAARRSLAAAPLVG